MATFADEASVREKFQLTDTTLVPGVLVLRSLDDAHIEILDALDPAYDVTPAEAGLILGEALLAGAHLLRSIAAATAFALKRVSVGGQRVEPSGRFDALLETAKDAEDRAWELLAPFLLPEPGRSAGTATDSIPVIEEVE